MHSVGASNVDIACRRRSVACALYLLYYLCDMRVVCSGRPKWICRGNFARSKSNWLFTERFGLDTYRKETVIWRSVSLYDVYCNTFSARDIRCFPCHCQVILQFKRQRSKLKLTNIPTAIPTRRFNIQHPYRNTGTSFQHPALRYMLERIRGEFYNVLTYTLCSVRGGQHDKSHVCVVYAPCLP